MRNLSVLLVLIKEGGKHRKAKWELIMKNRCLTLQNEAHFAPCFKARKHRTAARQLPKKKGGSAQFPLRYSINK